MAGITLVQAQAALDDLIAAHTALRSGISSYTMENGRTVQRFEIAQIRGEIEYWERRVKQLTLIGGTGTAPKNAKIRFVR
jgi:hypothetical protein